VKLNVIWSSVHRRNGRVPGSRHGYGREVHQRLQRDPPAGRSGARHTGLVMYSGRCEARWWSPEWPVNSRVEGGRFLEGQRVKGVTREVLAVYVLRVCRAHEQQNRRPPMFNHLHGVSGNREYLDSRGQTLTASYRTPDMTQWQSCRCRQQQEACGAAHTATIVAPRRAGGGVGEARSQAAAHIVSS